MLAISKLSYVAAFFPPSRAILKVEKRALQLLLRGPWNAIPDECLKHTRLLGLPAQAKDLATLSYSSRVHVASSTSPGVIAHYGHCRHILDTSDDVALGNLDHHILYESCLHHVVFQYRRFIQEFPELEGKTIKQKDAYAKLLGCRPQYKFDALICKRLTRYFTLESFEHLVPALLISYQSFAKKFGFAPVLSHLRAVQQDPPLSFQVWLPERLHFAFHCMSGISPNLLWDLWNSSSCPTIL